MHYHLLFLFKDGDIPLHIAATFKCHQVVTYLLKKDCDANIINTKVSSTESFDYVYVKGDIVMPVGNWCECVFLMYRINVIHGCKNECLL